jgi:UDP-N-acetylmuramate dehydrogenase
MTPAVTSFPLQRDAPIPTWFGIGGGADALATPRDEAELLACLDMDPAARILGDGANLLVHDAGVSELVVSLTQPVFTAVEPLPGRDGEPDRETVVVGAGAGASLPRVIIESVRMGLGGVEGLGGIPASIGGALVMNAGGSFGQIADVVRRVFAVNRSGESVSLSRDEIDFGYRRSGLNDLVVIGCEIELRRGDPAALRDKLKDVMAYKKSTQPMGEDSAGCCYKNPTLVCAIEDVGEVDERVSAGMVIDRAECKGLSVGGASVSERHANFFPVAEGALAADVIALMEEVERRVFDRFGISLEREVVIWQRGVA